MYASALDSCPYQLVEQAEVNDNSINACSFICVCLGHLLLVRKEDLVSTANETATRNKIVKMAERAIRDFPRFFNEHRNSYRNYDAQEAYTILRHSGVVTGACELTEEIVSSKCVYSI